MSSFLYRPTPVVNLGNGMFASKNVMGWLPGATMRGIPAGASALGKAGPTGAVSRMRRVNTAMPPWIATSGTMGSFLPNGLGQDDGSGIDWSTIDVSPVSPVSAVPDLIPPDLGLPGFSPNLPVSIGPATPPVAPIDWTSAMNVRPTLPVRTPPPPAGAGPTGIGIPGTQPLNPAMTAVSAGTGVLNAIKNFFSPAPAAPAGYKALPGYGGAPVAAASVIPGVSNTALAIGAALILVFAMSGSGGGRR